MIENASDGSSMVDVTVGSEVVVAKRLQSRLDHLRLQEVACTT